MPLRIQSPVFPDHGEIPVEYTCDGSDLSPALEWSGAPAGTRSLALIVDDPDAPDPEAPQRVWVHWVVYNLPPGAGGLAEGAGAHAGTLPRGALRGRNDWGRTDYGGPCPPIGRHRYFFKLYALDATLPDLDSPPKAALLRAMEGHVLEQVEWVGTYQSTA